MPDDRPAAVILAAGAGRRLGGLPKALYPVAGRPLLDWALERLGAAGIEHTLVVTGFHADAVERHLDGRARPVRNPESRDCENFVSLAVGLRAAPPGPVLVLNADVILAPGVVEATLADRSPLALAVCAGATDAEALKVEITGGRVVRLGKLLAPAASAGEFIGLSRLSELARGRYLERVDAARAAGRRDLYYEDVYSEICGELGATVVDVAADDWAEIDTPADVAAAERLATRE